jgi:hypothetical protein
VHPLQQLAALDADRRIADADAGRVTSAERVFASLRKKFDIKTKSPQPDKARQHRLV